MSLSPTSGSVLTARSLPGTLSLSPSPSLSLSLSAPALLSLCFNKINLKKRNKEQEEKMVKDLINTDISEMSKLEFKNTIIRILAGVEKSI